MSGSVSFFLNSYIEYNTFRASASLANSKNIKDLLKEIPNKSLNPFGSRSTNVFNP